ncbi:hypothetical protein FNU76_00630 [Chitinimonas arctica]|uniref:Uncharacterized protein n=1 Tax=Chitinimonas arctica TaxID=2594795 RepID=A0A516S9Z3_9NEIS|nr:hypothetical protein [Chitinimonas arctica]QDQ24970.1 hypothetical protein FNU76_00630 [Chitinimonas arctica]
MPQGNFAERCLLFGMRGGSNKGRCHGLTRFSQQFIAKAATMFRLDHTPLVPTLPPSHVSINISEPVNDSSATNAQSAARMLSPPNSTERVPLLTRESALASATKNELKALKYHVNFYRGMMLVSAGCTAACLLAGAASLPIVAVGLHRSWGDAVGLAVMVAGMAVPCGFWVLRSQIAMWTNESRYKQKMQNPTVQIVPYRPNLAEFIALAG